MQHLHYDLLYVLNNEQLDEIMGYLVEAMGIEPMSVTH